MIKVRGRDGAASSFAGQAKAGAVLDPLSGGRANSRLVDDRLRVTVCSPGAQVVKWLCFAKKKLLAEVKS